MTHPTTPPPPRSKPSAPSRTSPAAPAPVGTAPEIIEDEVGYKPPRLLISAVEGFGKCLGRGTPVLLFDGTIRAVEDIVDGDLLMGPDSMPRRVSGCHRGRGPLYRVTPTKGDSFVANDRHILSLRMSRRSGGEFHRIVNIPINEYVGKSPAFKKDALAWRTGVEWLEADLPLDPYLLGCWLGDGTSGQPCITTPDAEVVDAMNDYADRKGADVVFRGDAGAATTFAIRRRSGERKNPFKEDLRLIGVLHDKHVPHGYKTASSSQRLSLLAGFLDADGYVARGCFDVAIVNRRLAEDIAFVARSLGFAAYISPCEKCCTNSPTRAVGTYHRIIISGDTSRIPTRIGRRRAEPRRKARSVNVTGITVEPIGDGDFFGFEVDSDHLFLLGDFTVTHNTTFGASAPNALIAMVGDETGYETLRSAGRVPKCKRVRIQTWGQNIAMIEDLIANDRGIEYLVYDTMGGLERACHAHVCATEYKGNWGEKGFMGYQRGYAAAVTPWIDMLSRLNRLRDARSIGVIMLSHAKREKVQNPEGADYDRFSPDCHEKTWAPTARWCDATLFGGFIADVDAEADEKKGKLIAGKKRVVRAEPGGAYVAKNRYGMPDKIELPDDPDLMWTTIMQYINPNEGNQ